jgi:hypothetical protein
MKRLLFLLFAAVALLAACIQPITPPVGTPASTPLTPVAGEGEEFTSAEGGFALTLPAGWTISDPQETPLGTRLQLGPEPRDQDDPSTSVIYHADVRNMFLERAIEQLCDGACIPEPQVTETTLDGRRAWRAQIVTPEMPAREWYFVDNGDRFIFFTIHDPTTMDTRQDIVQSMRFTPVIDEDAAAQQIGLVVRQLLMQQLQLNFDQVEVISVEAVEWRDSCLGAGMAHESCALVTTPGYRVVLNAAGEEYVYHTDQTGSQVRLAKAPEPEIGELVLEWQQNDGFCQMARIGTEGVAFGACGGVLMQGYLVSDQRRQQLQEAVATYAPFEADTAAGHVVFQGQGTVEAAPSEQRRLAEWARLVQIEAAGGRSGASYGLAFAWHREGGIAGFCDDLAVYATGEVYASSCAGEQAQDLGSRQLTAEELDQVYVWIDSLQPFEIDETDPAVADAMTIRLVFSGIGQNEPTETERQAILDFAAELYAEFSQ